MTVRRLYAPILPARGGSVLLGEGPSRHARVLRLGPGDEVVLFDGAGKTARARIRIVDHRVECEADAPVNVESPRARVILMLAIPKGSKLDDCVRMATELGVDEIALMRTHRTIPQWDSERTRSRIDRLTRVANEAAAQCERSDIPIVHAPQEPAAWLEQIPPQATGVLFGARAANPMRLDAAPTQLWCAVGPEGGFTVEEVAAFQNAGFAVASLGKWILRVDTAVASALTLVRDRLRAVSASALTG